MSGKITKAALASQLGVTERRVHAIFAEGTTRREVAEKIASLYGGRAERYLREPKRRGRQFDIVAVLMRYAADQFAFREFILEQGCVELEGGEDWDSADNVISNLALEYLLPDNKLPDNIESLESLLTLMRNLKMSLEQRDAAMLVWNRYQCWRIDQVAAVAKYEVEDAE